MNYFIVYVIGVFIAAVYSLVYLEVYDQTVVSEPDRIGASMVWAICWPIVLIGLLPIWVSKPIIKYLRSRN